jgi:hypothetical protein
LYRIVLAVQISKSRDIKNPLSESQVKVLERDPTTKQFYEDLFKQPLLIRKSAISQKSIRDKIYENILKDPGNTRCTVRKTRLTEVEPVLSSLKKYLDSPNGLSCSVNIFQDPKNKLNQLKPAFLGYNFLGFFWAASFIQRGG